MTFFNKIFTWYFSKNALPYWAILLVDSCIILFSYILSVYICHDAIYLVEHFWKYVTMYLFTLPVLWLSMHIFHTYTGIFRYSSFVDLIRVLSAIVLGVGASSALTAIFEYHGLVYQLLSIKQVILSIIFSVVGLSFIRILVKYIFDITTFGDKAQRVLIYGVRNGGISLAKSMRNEHPTRFIVKGFISPESEMVGRFLLGNKVYADNEDIINIIKELQIQAIFVSPLVANIFRENNDFIKHLTHAHVRIMMMPDAEKWDENTELTYQQLHEVDIEDLLPRDVINVDLEAIGSLLYKKRILITGAAGSIGSEMSRQIARFSPKELILIDQAETPMHDVRRYMSHTHPSLQCETIVGSICNETHMEQLFSEHKPEYVFHAAAYKHVPMMEDNPAMAVQNNIYGTRVIADLAVKYGTRKFVMISTDKAVNPTNVMGCSKRICEIYCQSLNDALQNGTFNASPLIKDERESLTQFITTRFGNVLGSNGSVIPIFKEQIRKGGPVTVTHPDIIRYFMLIPEACQLVLEAGTMGKGGEIFVFDMGKPVRIADLAQRMIDLSGAKGVEIKFTGLRDGEKLYEEVLNDAEQTKPTIHPKIKIASVREYPYEEALRNEKELYDLSFTYDDMKIVAKMKQIVPEYKSRQSKYEILDNYPPRTSQSDIQKHQ